jgi:hypothetical protein
MRVFHSPLSQPRGSRHDTGSRRLISFYEERFCLDTWHARQKLLPT